ncbi:YbhB/YbcL family Raf kinase inhibitor-like protein [Corynebacterium sp. MSK006]|uniref:YbhB/YbcL family Raf kinase inhibitor-like protein n=1 Tax=Corynebacterium sp. MSK006 TaxID=3050187 RepID=UPI00254F7A3E|nr:YbhB/YbcL family Raf kinase inhibitor-like protein [Corynebacterium sp. MSK006]MDK8895744.1 YbhB/YbcL family Raf kinase inhibitor-like protein [Corynebacterium sp. MSK006]
MSNHDYATDPRFPGPDPYAPLKDLPGFELTSEDFENGAKLPAAQTAAENVSPQLSWSGLPEGTRSLAVTCYDPDAPTAAGFWHWAAFNIPVTTESLPAGAGAKNDLGIDGVTALRNDGGSRAFAGAAPPAGHGPHRYLFAVHAVDVEHLDVDADATPTVLGFNLYFHAIGRAILWGWHENE